MALAIFEDYSQTIEGTNHAPFIVDISSIQCYDKLLKWVKENHFEDIQPMKDYLEIFAKKEGFEYTFRVDDEKGNALVNASVYGKRGRTRKKLIQLLAELVKYFS